ncbi:response regulator [Paraflavitalea sp. CAU 1676]|uniref:response regulator n=1 Tax=Paraflavitalea sp. CAU 1676 TaxID=3032598 RepID=UPI0023DB9F30|nr:response regulator [Paraflavitalea sp. CAU 1676]MDF2191213.1 response regulator [Paraflavitalea sp. CAU 1676]
MEKLIMLIDDDGEELEILNEALSLGNIQATCVWAEGGEHAIQLLNHMTPDYIFIDINMPGMDGLSCLQELQKKRALTNIPKIIYSTAINDSTITNARERGAVGCIQKGDNIASLAVKLSAFLRGVAMSG